MIPTEIVIAGVAFGLGVYQIWRGVRSRMRRWLVFGALTLLFSASMFAGAWMFRAAELAEAAPTPQAVPGVVQSAEAQVVQIQGSRGLPLR